MSTHAEHADDQPSAAHRIVDAEPTAESVTAPRRGKLVKRVVRRKALLITDATRTPEQNLRHREKVYMVLQASRIPLLAVAMLVFWLWHLWWLAILILCIGIPIPWIAVVIANDKGEARDDRGANVYKPALAREALASRRAALPSQASGIRRGEVEKWQPGPEPPQQPPRPSAYGTGWGADTR